MTRMSQKLMIRYIRTASTMFFRLAPPNAVKAMAMLPSTAPSPPGVIGKLAANCPAP
jgi:hypothetical protein